MAEFLNGTWNLVTWRRIAGDGSVTYPLGADARGLLIYADNGRMAVQLTANNRAQVTGDDPLGGDAQARAAAYSTYLAYFGTYEVQGQNVVHHLDGSLFPNWSGASQVRPFTAAFDQLVLRTPPMSLAAGTTVVNELTWNRDRSLGNRQLSGSSAYCREYAYSGLIAPGLITRVWEADRDGYTDSGKPEQVNPLR